MNIDVNYVSVLVAGVAAMVVGFLWYSPMLFANPWMKLMGHTEKSMEAAKKNMGRTYAISFVMSLVMAYVLYHVMVMGENTFRYDRLTGGVSSAFWMWLGFVMPVQSTDVLFGGKSWKLFAINTGYQLAALLAMGVVLGYLK